MGEYDAEDLEMMQTKKPQAEQAPAGGQKHDAGKAPWHLLPWDAVDAMRDQLDEIGDEDMPGPWDVLGAAGRWFQRHGDVEDLALAAAYILVWLENDTEHSGGRFGLLGAVVDVLKFGAFEKPHPDPSKPPGYGPRNWEAGLDYSRVFGALCRHVAHAAAGELHDPETRLHPLAHALCDALFLLAYELRSPGWKHDDRPGASLLAGTVTTIGAFDHGAAAEHVRTAIETALEGAAAAVGEPRRRHSAPRK